MSLISSVVDKIQNKAGEVGASSVYCSIHYGNFLLLKLVQ